MRAVDYQRCLRVAGKHNDFEEVGRATRHHTLFEMLGNWSFGDYFKREAIHWAWQFLTRDLQIPAERLAATVYTTDDLAHSIWKDEIGLPPERLVRWGDFPTGDEANWWRMGDVGSLRALLASSTTTAARTSARAPSASRTTASTARAGSRSGTSCSWSSSSTRIAASRRCLRPGVDTGMGLERIAARRPGRDQQLRHGPVRSDPGADAGPARLGPGRLRGAAVQLPGHRGPQPRRHLPRGRRRAPVQRGPRLRPAPDHAPRHPPRAAPRPPRAVPGRDREGRHRHDGGRLSAPRRASRGDPGRHRARGAPVQPHPRGRRRPPRGGAHPADVGGAA